MSLPRLAPTSLAACEPLMSKGPRKGTIKGYKQIVKRQFPQILHSPKGMPEKQVLETKFFAKKDLGTHQTNTLANGGGKRI